MFANLIALVLLSQASIQLDRDDGQNVIRVVGGGNGTVAVYVTTEPLQSTIPAVLGKATRAGDDLLFTPRFPFESGLEYRVEFRSSDSSVVRTLRIPKAAAVDATKLVQIYPSVSQLPANQLKLYLQFSASMSRGVAYGHIHLLDDAGHEIEHAFLELGEELWDAKQERFTLLFDPGRIKRDLVPNLDDGAPLKVNQRYTLRIDSTWPDSKGSPLSAMATKQFTVMADDREAPNPAEWSLVPPRPNSREALTVNFPEPMDYGLLNRTLRVIDGDGANVPGAITVEQNEQRWRLTPNSPWKAGRYRLQIEGALEDLAGNRIGRLFEVDTRKSPETAKRPSDAVTHLDFTVSAR